MAHTQDAVIVDSSGVVHMVVIPDDDAQLSDPAFNPPGHTHLRVPWPPREGQHPDPVQAARHLHPEHNVRMPPPAVLAQGEVAPAHGNVTGNPAAA
jgi:hypothetical protein